MPGIIQVAVVAVALLILVVLALAIPMVIQMRRTGKAAEGFLNKLSQEMSPLLDQAKETGKSLDSMIKQAGRGLEKTQAFADALGDLAETIRLTNRLLRGSAVRLLINTAGLVAGFKSGAESFLHRLRQRR